MTGKMNVVLQSPVPVPVRRHGLSSRASFHSMWERLTGGARHRIVSGEQGGKAPTWGEIDNALNSLSSARDANRIERVIALARKSGVKSGTGWYRRLVETLAERELYEHIPSALAEMQQWAKSSRSIDVFNYALAALGAQKMTVEIEKILLTMKDTSVDPDINTYNALIYASICNGDVKGALALYEHARSRGVLPSPRTASYLLAIHCQRQDLSAALAAFEEMRACGVVGLNQFNTMNIALARTGDIQSCLSLLSDMEKSAISPSSATFKAITASCAKWRNFDRGLAVYQMVLNRMDAGTLIASTGLLNAFLALFSQRKTELKTAVAAFDAFVAHGVSPDVISLGLIAQVHGKMGHVRKVQAIFDEMKQRGIKPTAMAYNGLLDAYSRRNEPDQCLSIFNEMIASDVAPNINTFNTVILTCVRCGRGTEAVPIFHQMSKFGVRPNLKTFATMLKGGAVPVVVREAFEEHRRVNGRLPNAVAYGVLIGMYLKGNELDKAVSAFEEMMELQVEPRQQTYDDLVSTLIANSRVEDAVRIYEEMRRQSFKTGYAISTDSKETGKELTAIVNTLAAMGSSSTALVQSPVQVVTDTETFCKWIEELGEVNDLVGASRLVRALRRRGIRAEITMYNSLLKAYAKNGDVDGFLTTIEDMDRDSVSADSATVQVAHELRRTSGDVRLVRTLARISKT